jgi:proline iminopeptidase
MKNIIITAILALSTMIANGQNIYIKTFGESKNNPIIFMHGGPGYNCVNFEATTAQQLSEKGFFVIVYDRRGEGRSKDLKAKFNFNETFNDINSIYQKFNLTKATLIGHSFGGVVATLFAEANPQKVQSIILVGAPVSLQETFENIITKAKSIYQAKNDSDNLKYIGMLEKMDKTSIMYSSFCFRHAMQNGFYTPRIQTEEAKSINSKFKSDTSLLKIASQMTFEAPQGFWKNEKYTTIDLKNNIKSLQKTNIKVFGLYGKDDGLYSNEQVTELQKLIGYDNLRYIDNCSHNVFIDQQSLFIDAVKSWTN